MRPLLMLCSQFKSYERPVVLREKGLADDVLDHEGLLLCACGKGAFIVNKEKHFRDVPASVGQDVDIYQE